MHCINRFTVQTILTLGIVIHLYSGDPTNAPATPKFLSTIENSTTNAPFMFPSTANMTLTEAEFNAATFRAPVPTIPPLCWPNISRAFWPTMLHFERKYTGKHFQRLQSRFKELTRNFNEQILQMVSTADQIRNLMHYNSTEEDIKEENRQQCDKDSEEYTFTRSITVPILLIVILMLLTYIAFLYRKLQFARYKDAPILVQDELIDPWATR